MTVTTEEELAATVGGRAVLVVENVDVGIPVDMATLEGRLAVASTECGGHDDVCPGEGPAASMAVHKHPPIQGVARCGRHTLDFSLLGGFR